MDYGAIEVIATVNGKREKYNLYVVTLCRVGNLTAKVEAAIYSGKSKYDFSFKDKIQRDYPASMWKIKAINKLYVSDFEPDE